MNHVKEIDRTKALLLIDASVQAYAALGGQTNKVTPPAGYELVDTWTGVDSIFGGAKTVECYGVVFRSRAAPYTYVFAFRGTSSFMDMLDDVGTDKQPFTPHESSAPVAPGVEVESGFFYIYTEADGSTRSMQAQLFELLDGYQASSHPIERLYLTGHSLGAALSELFTLDLALSRPDLGVASNYNFACPRVGNAEFVAFYDAQRAQQDPALRTLRIQNTHDRVPCMPTEDMGYQHVPDAYLVAFHKDGWLDLEFLVHNHSSVNYQAVLQCAFSSDDGVCVRDALPVSGDDYELTCTKPDPADVCSLWP